MIVSIITGACIGCGVCSEHSSLFNTKGKKAKVVSTTVNDEDRSFVKSAARDCPMNAIVLTGR